MVPHAPNTSDLGGFVSVNRLTNRRVLWRGTRVLSLGTGKRSGLGSFTHRCEMANRDSKPEGEKWQKA
jgi:hypothetical protein